MLRRLLKCVREYKWAAILAPVTMIGEVAMEVTIPSVMASLIDKGVSSGDVSMVVKQGLLLVLCALLSLSFGAGSALLASKAATGFAYNLRHDMFHRVQSFDFMNIDKFSTSSIITRLTTDVSRLQNTFQMSIRMAIRCPMMLTLALIMALRINPKLCLIYLCVMPFLMVGLMIIAKSAFPIFDKVFRTMDTLNNVVQENLHGVRVVKSFVREEQEKEKFNGVAQNIYDLHMKAERILALNSPLMQVAIYTCTIAISYIGAVLVVRSGNSALNGGLTTGQLGSMFTYTSQVLMSLMMLSMVFVMLTMTRSAVNRCGEILVEEPGIVAPENPVHEVKDGSIDFENVSFRYSAGSGKNALENVNLHIESGMTVGILGGTGSSKSTLVQLIPRLYDVTEGTLKVGGVNVKDYDILTLRDQVSMVLQKNELFAGTIKENLRWGDPDATDEELIHACKLACADEFITGFPNGYDTQITQGGTNVSGGQKQRLCIARALLKKPKILILDDSTKSDAKRS